MRFPAPRALPLALVLVPVFAVAANAQSLTGSVSGAGIDRGEREIEARFGMSDDGAAGSRVHVQYGFTDWYRARIVVSATDRIGEGWRYGGATLDNHFQWAAEADDNSGFNGGLRLSYTAEGRATDSAGIRFIVTDRFAPGWEWRINLDAEMPVDGQFNDDAELEVRANLTRALDMNVAGTRSWRAGIELFSEMGTPETFLDDRFSAHQAGGVLQIGFENDISLALRARAGLSRGADDAMFQIAIGREF